MVWRPRDRILVRVVLVKSFRMDSDEESDTSTRLRVARRWLKGDFMYLHAPKSESSCYLETSKRRLSIFHEVQGLPTLILFNRFGQEALFLLYSRVGRACIEVQRFEGAMMQQQIVQLVQSAL